MTSRKPDKALDTSTEMKIKNAARTVFYQKGYAATRTRDIAEAAGINLALLNYYFRSKEKLFEMIMLETLLGFMKNMVLVLNNKNNSLKHKVEAFVSKYIDLLFQEPEIPTFIMSELRNNSSGLLQKLPFRQLVVDSVFFEQYKKAVALGEVVEPNPLHFLINLLGLVVFPFVAKPIVKGIGGLNDIEFDELINERKKLIPNWIFAMMKVE